jgi:FdhD protein
MKPAVQAKISRYERGEFEEKADDLATEEPLEIRIEGQSVAVLMRTPGHDRELAAGFLVGENIVRKADDIFEITVCGEKAAGSDETNVVNVTLKNPARFDATKFSRNFISSASCGICGKTSIDSITKQFAPINSKLKIAAKLLFDLPARLAQSQKTFRLTGGLHACALFEKDGTLIAAREDVGRHNALDKLIGHALLENQLPLAEKILLLSGRVSFEMVQKALAAGVAITAAISAPTSLAVEFAQANNQTLIGFLRGEEMNIYAGAERIYRFTRGRRDVCDDS